MSDLLINKTRMNVGSSAGDKVRIVASDALSFERTCTINPVPTQGQMVQQLGAFLTLGYTFTCPSDSRHDPIFRAMPHRLYYDALLRGSGTARKQRSGQGPATLTLNLTQGAPCSWTVAIQTDGAETEGNAATSPVPVVPVNSYQEQAVRYFFGNKTDLIELTDVSQGGSVTCTTEIVTTNRRTGVQAVQSVARDATSKGLSATVAIVLTDTASGVISQLIGMDSGILLVARTDADYAYGFPASVADLSQNAPVGGAATASLVFVQSPGGSAVAGPLLTSGNATVPSGQEGYIVDTAGTDVTRVTSTTAVPSKGLAVVGAPLAIL